MTFVALVLGLLFLIQSVRLSYWRGEAKWQDLINKMLRDNLGRAREEAQHLRNVLNQPPTHD